jgi:ATP-dependent Lhr-like helicase
MVFVDGLLRSGLEHGIPDGTQVVYVSPLKALSNDVRKNLLGPLEGIQALAEERGLRMPSIRIGVRTGDTQPRERRQQAKVPPHILITTPESLYLMLTAERSRALLTGVRTVIVDELHALMRNKRGSHLALSLARLDALCAQSAPPPHADSTHTDADSPRASTPTLAAPASSLQLPTARPIRVGLSATVHPIEEAARFLIGSGRTDDLGAPACTIVNVGHTRDLDLRVEVPPSDLQAVATHEQWSDIYDRLAELIAEHRTTLVFVNTRKMAERIAARLSKILGEDRVTSHHGSLSKKHRLDAEQRLKDGKLRALVATASCWPMSTNTPRVR